MRMCCVLLNTLYISTTGKYAVPGYPHKLGLLLFGPPGVHADTISCIQTLLYLDILLSTAEYMNSL
jgi:hypothetical protein